MTPPIPSRRDFLKLTALSLPAVAAGRIAAPPPPALPLGRVAARFLDLREKPDSNARCIRQIPKDTLIQIQTAVDAHTQAGISRWLQTREGYVLSGDVQPVEYHPQIPVTSIPQTVPAEVCVPITQSYKSIAPEETILYRLYYQSIHWVTGVEIQLGEVNRIWYKLHDQQLGLDLYAPGEHFRLIAPAEYAPLSAAVPPEKKRIEISLARQILTAYEDDRAVREFTVSTGMLYDKNTVTPKGVFHVQNKTICVHMGDGRVTPDPLAYELPGIPWVSYFETQRGIATHGTYWHNDFGRPRSHGCVNMRPADALWIYRWCAPPAPQMPLWGTVGFGTAITIY